MSSPQTTNNSPAAGGPAAGAPVAPERLAEAGVWISRLHGGNRTRADEIGLKRWLREDPENARAFEIATEVWDDAENLRRFVPLKPKFLQRPRSSMTPIFTAVAMASVLLVIGAVLWFQNLGVITTGVGVIVGNGVAVFTRKHDVRTRVGDPRRRSGFWSKDVFLYDPIRGQQFRVEIELHISRIYLRQAGAE